MYFTQNGKMTANKRKLDELSFHLIRSGDSQGFLYQCLSNFDWLNLIVRKSSIYDLLDEIDFAKREGCVEDPEAFEIIRNIVSLSAKVVSQDKTRFPGQLLSRIPPSATLPNCLQNLVIQARLFAFEENIR